MSQTTKDLLVIAGITTSLTLQFVFAYHFPLIYIAHLIALGIVVMPSTIRKYRKAIKEEQENEWI